MRSNFENEANVDYPQSDWGAGTVPFLAGLKKRRESVYEQLAALEDGTFPRPSEDFFNKGETCADWTSTSPGDDTDTNPDGGICGDCKDAAACYNNDGCGFRKEDGTWNTPYDGCTPANGYCDGCFCESACVDSSKYGSCSAEKEEEEEETPAENEEEEEEEEEEDKSSADGSDVSAGTGTANAVQGFEVAAMVFCGAIAVLW